MGPDAVSVAVGSILSADVAGSLVAKENDCACAEATATRAGSTTKDLIVGNTDLEPNMRRQKKHESSGQHQEMYSELRILRRRWMRGG